jgi:hypothetical protein
MELTAPTLILLLLLTGYANDVLLGQPRACTGRVIGAIGTGDGALVKNAFTCMDVVSGTRCNYSTQNRHVPRDRLLYC